jgi:hypothetical protein
MSHSNSKKSGHLWTTGIAYLISMNIGSYPKKELTLQHSPQDISKKPKKASKKS